jgi:uncharacterized protein (TIGR02001 family)
MGTINKLTATAAALLGTQAIQAGELAVTPAVVSDYDFRGITQTAKDPAFQLGATYSFDNGVYVMGWGSNLDEDSYPDVDFEFDAGIGFAGGDAEKAVGYDVGLVAYTYPGNSDINYEEIYAGISKGWFSGKLWYSNEFAGADDSAYYIEGNGTFPLPQDFSFVAHLGFSGGDFWENTPGVDEYFDFAVGLAKSFGKADIALKYIDGSDLPDAGTDVFSTDSKVWLSVSTTFPWGE